MIVTCIVYTKSIKFTLNFIKVLNFCANVFTIICTVEISKRLAMVFCYMHVFRMLKQFSVVFFQKKISPNLKYFHVLTLLAPSFKNCILLQCQVIQHYSNLLIKMVTKVDFGAFLRHRLKLTMVLKKLKKRFLINDFSANSRVIYTVHVCQVSFKTAMN